MAQSQPFSSDDAIRHAILQYIAANPDRPMKPAALRRELDIPHERAAAFRECLRDMIDAGELVPGSGRTLALPARKGVVVGVYRATRHGYGFVEIPGRTDLFVPRGADLHALEGDTVQVKFVKAHMPGKEPHAEVTRILQRAPVRWVGVLRQQGKYWFVDPQGRTPAPIVSIQDPTAKNARPGDLVAVEPLSHTLDSHHVQGVIVERLGRPDETTARILGVIHRSGLPLEFPAEVRSAAQAATAFLSCEVPPDREDLRETLTITIDPPDARDFDDAISIRHLPGGNTELGVHIADVAHFVEPDSPLDIEAKLRGNSVYFPGFVVPMLPEVLSNGVCSLQPHQARLTKSAFITYDATGNVLSSRFSNSVIRSHARLTYDQVAAFLDGKRTEVSHVIGALLRSAEKLAQTIRKRRLAKGMISLSIPKAELVLGDAGKVVDIRPEDTSFSHTIIEMFMVEANEAVCRLLHAEDIPHIRRVHPPPDPDASMRFSRLVTMLGKPIKGDLDRPAILRLLSQVRDDPVAPTVHYLLLRCLSQACYRATREGHFALASDHYCHFTSPIRRYPDLIVHRLLNMLLREVHAPQRKHRRQTPNSPNDIEAVALHCSMTERRAAEAERDARQLLMLEFMKEKVGDELPGVITGVTALGVFVQIHPYLAEGFVHRSALGGGRWDFDRETSRLRMHDSARFIAIGQRVRVAIAGIDEIREQLDLLPASAFQFGLAETLSKSGSDSRGKSKSGKRRSKNHRR